MLFSARIKELEQQLAQANTEKDALTASNQTLTTQLAEHTAEVSGLQSLVATHEATIKTLNADLDTARTAATDAQAAATDAQAALKAEQDASEKKIADGIIAGIAAAGGKPIARDPNAAPKAGDTKPENKLTGRDKTVAYFAERMPKAPAATV